MKQKIFYLIIIAFLIITSCSNKNGPEHVANSFLEFLDNKQYEEARQISTAETQKMIDFLELLYSDEPIEKRNITDMKCIEKGNTATCTFRDNGEEDNIQLVKEDKTWKVHMPKEFPDTDVSYNYDDDEIIEIEAEKTGK